MKLQAFVGILCCLSLFFVLGSEAAGTEDDCAGRSNTTCSKCVDNKDCYWCESNNMCATMKTKEITQKKCTGQDWKYKQCIVSGKVLMIALPCVAFVVLLAIGCTIYCCCCRKKKRGGPDKEEARWKRQREEIEIKHKERRAERQQRHDDIRKKYGLFRKEEGKYEQFDNEATA